jgi:hypothetical protein
MHASVGFEPTIAVLERAKTVRALDRSTTAIGNLQNKFPLHMRMTAGWELSCFIHVYIPHLQTTFPCLRCSGEPRQHESLQLEPDTALECTAQQGGFNGLEDGRLWSTSSGS